MKVRKLEIEFRTALHHGSGFGIAGLVDRAVARDDYGTPYLSGAAIKGRLRHACLRLLKSQGARAHDYGDHPGACSTNPCALCDMFGSRYRPGRLLFSDAYPATAERRLLEELSSEDLAPFLPADSAIRPGVSIDRRLGTVRKQLLYTTETLPPYLVFEGSVEGDLEGDARGLNVEEQEELRRRVEEQEKLLRNAALVLTHFGAGGARGLGFCEWKIGEPR